MERLLLFSGLLCFFLSAEAQETFSGEAGLYVGTNDIPALSELSLKTPGKHFHLTEVDIFKKEEKREVNMLGIVEREKRFQQSIENYDTPLFAQKKKEGSLQISDNVHLYNRASNYDYYTGKLKNPVYREMEAHLFNDFYRRQYSRSSLYYSSFLR